MRKINRIILHCSATRPSMDIGVEEITAWHKQRGFLTIGYHYVIRRDGEVEHGRPIEQVGAHCKGHNKDSIGICLVGGVTKGGAPEDNFTDDQFMSLTLLLSELRGEFGEGVTVHGHNEYANKACPCFDIEPYRYHSVVQ